MFICKNLAAWARNLLPFFFFVTALPIYAQQTPRTPAPAPTIPPSVRNVLALIQPATLRGDLSFLSSDALAGRYTPSPGLDIAAEFIASQFRSAGLQPGGNRDYFQVADMIDRKMPAPRSSMEVSTGKDHQTVPVTSIVITSTSAAVTLDHCPVIIAEAQTPDALRGRDLTGKVVLAPAIIFDKIPSAQVSEVLSERRLFEQVVRSSGAKALVVAGKARRSSSRLLTEQQAGDKLAVISAESAALQDWIEHPSAAYDRTITFDVPAPEDKKVELKNVIAVLPGSDPVLRGSYVMLTAHYDHIGTFETGKSLSATHEANPADHIFNGANDDGSGTVSVVEIAKALARLSHRPKRSIIFMTFFGEERGDIGSGYYGEHPAFPISQTVADLNLEQVGRTDSTEGKKINNASVTGYDYSDVTKYLEEAGRLTGIKVYLEKPASDDYFVRSDNAALAEQGVPAHTLCVAFDYPDYHGLGDEWQKIDYDNMARVDRMVALALFNLANNPVAPKWNRNNPKTAPFREAQTKLRSAGGAEHSKP